MTTDASDAWKQWHEHRVEAVSEPYGPLALAGTHWLEDHPDGRLPGVPGTWILADDGVLLTARGTDGLTLDGRPFDGEARLTADLGPTEASRVAFGERRLVVLVREGVWGVRDFDPGSAARRSFRGIEATPYDPRWSVRGASRRTTPRRPSGCRTRTGSSAGSGSAVRSRSRSKGGNGR